IDVGPIPQLGSTEEWISFPLLRDMDRMMYERQRGADLEIGSYAHRPLLHRPEEIPPVGDHPGQATPTSFPFTEQDFEEQMGHAREMFPQLLSDPEPPRTLAINGLLSLTPDGGALIGELPEVRGLWSAAAVWIKEAAGAGRMLAELLTDGRSEIDPHWADQPRCAPAACTPAHVDARAGEGVPKIYGITHPREQWLSDRPLRTSPFHPRTQALGAQYFETAGWERPQWYEANAPLLAEYADRIPARPHEWDSRWWSPIIEAEHLAMRERVAMVDLGAFAIFDVSGPGALAYLEHLALARVDVRIGRVVYTPLLTAAGGFRSDLTIVRRGPDHFRVITGGAAGGRDWSWSVHHRPGRGLGAADRRHLRGVDPRGVGAARPGPALPSDRGRPRRRGLRFRHGARRAAGQHPGIDAADLLRRRAGMGDPCTRRARAAAVGPAVGGRTGVRCARRRDRRLRHDRPPGEGLPPDGCRADRGIRSRRCRPRAAEGETGRLHRQAALPRCPGAGGERHSLHPGARGPARGRGQPSVPHRRGAGPDARRTGDHRRTGAAILRDLGRSGALPRPLPAACLPASPARRGGQPPPDPVPRRTPSGHGAGRGT